MPQLHWVVRVLPLLGGLALFLFAMTLMVDMVRDAAGPLLRRLLRRATSSRPQGVMAGVAMGSLILSGPTVVMLIAFVHAGLISLAAALPPLIGANIGTTLAMQVISFRVGDYWYIPVIVGVFSRFVTPHPVAKAAGRMAVGFGLLFLAISVMSNAILPLREHLAPWLIHVHGASLRGMVAGILLSALVTALLQSSGAMLAICFALIHAGAFTSLEQVYPIVLGAHIGTCTTALLASIGTSMDARRTAMAHLLFNVLGTLLAALAFPWAMRALPMLSTDLLRQTANLHTGTMLLTGLLVLPWSGLFARFVKRLTPSRLPEEEPSFLDEQLLETPEQAIYASIRELQRVARLSARSFRLNGEIMVQWDRKKAAVIRRNEETIDEIQRSMRDYLTAMTRRYLSRRQALLIQHLNRCMTDIERIEDHNDNLCHLSASRHRDPQARFPAAAWDELLALRQSADNVLRMVIQSLDPDSNDFQTMARSILQARDEYATRSTVAKDLFSNQVASHTWHPMVGMYLSDYVSEFDRMVRHSKNIAVAVGQPYFWIKPKKFNRLVAEAPTPALPPEEVTQDLLDKIQNEDFV